MGTIERGYIHLHKSGELAGRVEAARKISPDTYVNIMDQYRPCFKASEHPSMNRRITSGEFEEALAIAREEGIRRLLPIPRYLREGG